MHTRKTFKTNISRLQKLPNTNHGKFYTATETEMKIKGHVTLVLYIDNRRCETELHVVQGLNQQVILGCDWLTNHGACIDFRDKTIHFQEKIWIKNIAAVTIEPGMSMLIKGKCINSKLILPSGLNGEIKPTTRSNDRLMVSSVACTAFDNCVAIPITNTSHVPITLRKGRALTQFIPLLEGECKKPLRINKIENDAQNSEKDEKHTVTFNLEKTKCSPEQMKTLKEVLNKNHKSFVDASGKLGLCDWVQHKIQVKPDAVPIVKAPYRVAPEARRQVEAQIDEFLRQGILQEVESEWSAPLLIITKGVKSSHKHLGAPEKPQYRFTIDLRGVNASTVYNQCPIPRMSDLLDAIGEKKPNWFSVLDLSRGYLQQKLHPDSIPICAFAFGNRTLAFSRSPQGLSGSPSQFSKLMYKVLGPFFSRGVCNYLDDTVIFSNSFEEHMKLLDDVLGKFAEANLKLNPKKCVFATDNCDFLGMNLSSKGLTPCASHIEAIKSYPCPTSVKEVRVFLGLVNFFSNFIKEKATKTAPLTALTKKGASLTWTKHCQQCFETLRKDLSREPVLAFADFTERFYVFTDASQTISIGGTLAQKDPSTGNYKAVAHCGRALRTYEKSLAIPELECLACVYCLTKWDVYLSGAEFDLYTDHQALTSVLGNSTKLSPKLGRWALFLSEYKYQVHYKPGLMNASADAMSRRTYDYDRTKEDDIIDDYPNHPKQDMQINRVTIKDREIEHMINSQISHSRTYKTTVQRKTHPTRI